jgi:hypothetical protein
MGTFDTLIIIDRPLRTISSDVAEAVLSNCGHCRPIVGIAEHSGHSLFELSQDDIGGHSEVPQLAEEISARTGARVAVIYVPGEWDVYVEFEAGRETLLCNPEHFVESGEDVPDAELWDAVDHNDRVAAIARRFVAIAELTSAGDEYPVRFTRALYTTRDGEEPSWKPYEGA